MYYVVCPVSSVGVHTTTGVLCGMSCLVCESTYHNWCIMWYVLSRLWEYIPQLVYYVVCPVSSVRVHTTTGVLCGMSCLVCESTYHNWCIMWYVLSRLWEYIPQLVYYVVCPVSSVRVHTTTGVLCGMSYLVCESTYHNWCIMWYVLSRL